jgi:hypothetical protein
MISPPVPRQLGSAPQVRCFPADTASIDRHAHLTVVAADPMQARHLALLASELRQGAAQ